MTTELISITFHTTTGANEMAAFLESLEAQHLVEVKDIAVVTKYDEQHVVVRHRTPVGPGAVTGAVAGTVVGLPAGPAGAVTGFVSGILAGGAVDATRVPGFQEAELQEMARHELGASQSMLLVYTDEKYGSSIAGMAHRWDAALDPRSAVAQPGQENIEGATIRRQTVESANASWDEVLKKDRAEVAKLREQVRTKVQAERNKAQQALATANAKLDQQYQKTLHTLNEWQRKARADVARLETNLKQANAGAKASMEQQVAKAREANQAARTQIKATLAARLDDLKADIESLQMEITRTQGEVSAVWKERIAYLRAQGQAERARLEQLDENLDSAWEAMSENVQKAIDTYRSSVRAAETQYQATDNAQAAETNEPSA